MRSEWTDELLTSKADFLEIYDEAHSDREERFIAQEGEWGGGPWRSAPTPTSRERLEEIAEIRAVRGVAEER